MVSRDDGLVEQIRGAAASIGQDPLVTREAAAVHQHWNGATAVFVGAESVGWVVGQGLAERPRVHLVGRDAEQLVGWSAPLGASVVVLPEQLGLVSALLEGTRGGRAGEVVRILGATGGIGTSWLACALALAGARAGHTCALVEHDLGGGLDVALGVEDEPGWRWDDLVGARGNVADLGERLPGVEGVPVVSMGRKGLVPAPEAVAAVIGSLRRDHARVVVDAGRDPSRCGLADVTLVLVADRIASVLAARSLLAQLRGSGAEVVVRRHRSSQASAAEIGRVLGREPIGVLPVDRRIDHATAIGVRPSGRGRCARAVEALSERIGAGQAVAGGTSASAGHARGGGR